jgi:hypothetical protein
VTEIRTAKATKSPHPTKKSARRCLLRQARIRTPRILNTPPHAGHRSRERPPLAARTSPVGIRLLAAAARKSMGPAAAQPVPGDLDQPGEGARDHSQFLTDPAPHLRPDMTRRGWSSAPRRTGSSGGPGRRG